MYYHSQYSQCVLNKAWFIKFKNTNFNLIMLLSVIFRSQNEYIFHALYVVMPNIVEFC